MFHVAAMFLFHIIQKIYSNESCIFFRNLLPKYFRTIHRAILVYVTLQVYTFAHVCIINHRELRDMKMGWSLVA